MTDRLRVRAYNVRFGDAIGSLIGSLLELKGNESPQARSPPLRYALALLYMAQKPPDRSSARASIGDAVALETARQSDIYNYDPAGLARYLELQASIKSSAVASVEAMAHPYALQLSPDHAQYGTSSSSSGPGSRAAGPVSGASISVWARRG